MIIWAFCPEEYIILCSFLFVTPCVWTLVAISSNIFMLNWNWSVALSSFLWCSACWVSKWQLLQYRNIHFPGSAMLYWSVNTVIFLRSLLDTFICSSPILPTPKLDEVILWGSEGWSESRIHPYKPDLLYETRRCCLEFTQVSLCGNHFMHSGYRQYEHQIMDSLHINLLIWGVSLLKIWHCLLSSLLSLDVLHSKMLL